MSSKRNYLIAGAVPVVAFVLVIAFMTLRTPFTAPQSPTAKDVGMLADMSAELAMYAANPSLIPAVVAPAPEDESQWFDFFDENGRGLDQDCGGFSVARKGDVIAVATADIAIESMCKGVRLDHLWVRSQGKKANFAKYPVRVAGHQNGFTVFVGQMPQIADRIWINKDPEVTYTF